MIQVKRLKTREVSNGGRNGIQFVAREVKSPQGAS